jgi:hypothetical protein
MNVPACTQRLPFAQILSRHTRPESPFSKILIGVLDSRSNPVEVDGISDTADHGGLTIQNYLMDAKSAAHTCLEARR